MGISGWLQHPCQYYVLYARRYTPVPFEAGCEQLAGMEDQERTTWEKIKPINFGYLVWRYQLNVLASVQDIMHGLA